MFSRTGQFLLFFKSSALSKKHCSPMKVSLTFIDLHDVIGAVIENELVEELGEHLEDDDIWEDDFDLEPEVCYNSALY